jgi:uncharacterized membrane protein YidH (DUF202 family)
MPPGREPAIRDPADRTRLAWTRTAIAFAALGAAMLRWSPLAGGVVLALSVPVWAAVRARPQPGRSARVPLLVTAIVVIVGRGGRTGTHLGAGPASLRDLVHGR